MISDGGGCEDDYAWILPMRTKATRCQVLSARLRGDDIREGDWKGI